MAHHNDYDEPEDDFIDDEFDENEDDGRPNEAVAGVGAWGVSFVIHAIALLSLCWSCF